MTQTSLKDTNFLVFLNFLLNATNKSMTLFLLCKIMGILHNTHYILYNTSITICVVSGDNREKAVPKKMRRERERENVRSEQKSLKE